MISPKEELITPLPIHIPSAVSLKPQRKKERAFLSDSVVK